MKLNNVELYTELKTKNINKLYHANTLITSLSFIQLGGIAARGTVEKHGLLQTAQKSDTIDHKYNVWNDIFLDTVDLHNYKYSNWYRQNEYGPILFELKSELLLDAELDNIWITTNNPSNWTEDSKSNYFKNVSDYISNINENRQQKMITIRGIDRIVSFEKYLSCIHIDNPFILLDSVNLYQYCYDSINEALKQSNINTIVLKHECPQNCYCHQNYRQMGSWKIKKLFLE